MTSIQMRMEETTIWAIPDKNMKKFGRENKIESIDIIELENLSQNNVKNLQQINNNNDREESNDNKENYRKSREQREWQTKTELREQKKQILNICLEDEKNNDNKAAFADLENWNEVETPINVSVRRSNGRSWCRRLVNARWQFGESGAWPDRRTRFPWSTVAKPSQVEDSVWEIVGETEPAVVVSLS